MKLLIEWELFPFRFTAKSFDGEDGPDGEIIDRLTVLQQTGDETRMKLDEALLSIAASDAQVNKGIIEVRKQLDDQTKLIEELKNTTLTPEQQKIVTDLAGTSQAIDDVVPDAVEIPPVDPNAPPIPEAKKAGGGGGHGSGTTFGKGK